MLLDYDICMVMNKKVARLNETAMQYSFEKFCHLVGSIHVSRGKLSIRAFEFSSKENFKLEWYISAGKTLSF